MGRVNPDIRMLDPPMDWTEFKEISYSELKYQVCFPVQGSPYL